MYCYFLTPQTSNNKSLFKSKELPQKNSKTITIDDVEDENSKSNECTSSVDGKSTSNLSNDLKNSSSTHKSNSNECTLSLGNNSKNLLLLNNQNQMVALCH